MSNAADKIVMVIESGDGPYAQFVTAGHHVMAADEPQQLGGRDTGLSPYEYLLASLGACTAMTLRMYAARRNWPLRRVTVTLRHEASAYCRQEGRDGSIPAEYRIERDLNGEQRAKLWISPSGVLSAARCSTRRKSSRSFAELYLRLS